ncbi:MAG: transglycosylase domain-containing protein [bacterium]|nr:transglycosylase domain-containing protein [bacterium]
MRKKFTKLSLIISVSLLGVIAFGLVAFALIVNGLPNPEEFENRKVGQSTKIYDRTGEVLLYEIHGEEKRTVIPFEEIPGYIKQATIAIEDSNFYKNPAFDWRAIARAVLVNLRLREGYLGQGGSTITQQLARNAFLSSEKIFIKDLIRKVKELFLAIELEKQYTKDEILGLYLNQIPYGGNAYGIEAATQTFFGKSAKELTLAEAALLASLPRGTSYYSPWGKHVDELYKRKNQVLDRMESLGFITAREKEQAQKIEFTFTPQVTGIKAPHFVLTVQDYLNKKYGEEFVQSSGMSVITTLDWNLQQAAEKAVNEGAARNTELYKGNNAALMAQDANTGQIVAMVGSKDYFGEPEPENCMPGKDCRFEGNFNVVVQGLRQPGSAMKPFAYATAFKNGYSPSTVVFDLPTEFAASNPKCPATVDFKNENKECFHPQNFDNDFHGPVTLRNALAQSINIPAVKVLYLAGLDNTLKTAKDFGITTLTERGRYGLSLVLGGGEITLWDLVGAYSVFAQDGNKHQQTMILKITDNKNEILEEFRDSVASVIDAQSVRLINDILTDTQARSPLFQSSFGLTVFPGHEVALKTGTTNDYRDAWAMGYTPDLVVGVWAGNNNNQPMEKHGSSILAAVPIWNAFWKEALKDRSLTTFPKPDMAFNKKAMLRGESVAKYRAGDKYYPQIHTILYYVDKTNPNGPAPENPERDSQFKNWEEPILNWAVNHISNFFNIYNQPLPPNAVEESIDSEIPPGITFLSYKNGDFIKTKTISIQAQIISQINIKIVELSFNGLLVDKRSGDLGKSFNYQYSFTPQDIALQNSVKIKITDSSGNQNEKEIILYK